MSPLPTQFQDVLHLLIESASPFHSFERTRRHTARCSRRSARRAPQLVRWASKNLRDFAPELILAKACAPDLVFVQTTKEVHHEQRKSLQR